VNNKRRPVIEIIVSRAFKSVSTRAAMYAAKTRYVSVPRNWADGYRQAAEDVRRLLAPRRGLSIRIQARKLRDYMSDWERLA